MDEAVVNEYPGREVGVFLSIGTGKRPGGTSHQQQEWWEGFVGGGIGDFAEARRRLISKIEGCEDTHQYMRNEHLAKRGVNPENYYRLNVEVGVGEFGMNEWSRVADISTSTKRYINKPETQQIIYDAGAKMARIERTKRRHASYTTAGELNSYEKAGPYDLPPLHDSLAVELPGDDAPSHYSNPQLGPQYASKSPHHYQQMSVPQDKFSIVSSDEYPQVVDSTQARRSGETQHTGDNPRISTSSVHSRRKSNEGYGRVDAPPLPPKTPIQHLDGNHVPRYQISPRSNGASKLPYPDTDGPPPVVNMARKPEFIGR